MIENGKFVSRSPHLVPVELAKEFMEKEVGFHNNKEIEWFDSQVVKINKVEKSDDDNSQPLEIKNGERNSKKIEIVENNKSNNEVLTIKLNRIKKITVKNDNLEIEFNGVQSDQNGSQLYSVNQVITNEQVDNNQELKAVKDYLQKTGKDSLNRKELEEFFNSSSVPSEEKPKDTNKLL